MGNRCAHPHQETRSVPEPDAAKGLQRSLVRNTTIQEDAGVEPFMDFIRIIATRFFHRAVDHWNPLVSESQDPMEICSPTVIRRGQPSLTAEHPVC
ncbi:hypothetical protein Trydic_g2190 [Trypoxylus dichotomus]